MIENASEPAAVRHFPEVVVRQVARTWGGVRTEFIVAQREAPDFRLCSDHHTIMVPLRNVMVQANDAIDDGVRFRGMRQVKNITVVPANRTLRGWSDGPSEVPYLMIDIEPAFVEGVLADELETEGCDLLPRISVNDPGLHDLCLRMKAECERPGPASEQLGSALALAMTIDLIRRHSTIAHAAPADRGGLSAWQTDLVRAYVSEHLDRPIGLDQMAAVVRMSRFHFSRAFSRSFGVPPLRYVTLQRVERAKSLLAEGRLGIKQIAYACGYANRSHFGTVFRGLAGMTPRDYCVRICGRRAPAVD
ncbi:MAG: AraC family transcriptional regulator [Dongiaceae bacterium]